jgi:TPR repeat protein
LKGISTTQDFVEAASWFQLGAQAGIVEAEFMNGYCYFHGYGLPKNHVEAVYWFWVASDKGCACAQYNLGKCYLDGTGVDQNPQEGAKWMLQSAEQDIPEAQLETSRARKCQRPMHAWRVLHDRQHS